MTLATSSRNDSPSNELAKCPGCGNFGGRTVIDRSDVPVLCNVLSTTQSEARRVDRGELRLMYCPKCTLIHNAAFDDRKVTYTGKYENAQHYSERFSRFLEETATDLVTRYKIVGKTVVDIGCGDGRLLRMICAAGNNRGIGFDPAAPTQGDFGDEQVTIRRELYSESSGRQPADFVCCRHVLEHIHDPLAFLRMVRRAVGDNTECRAYFEVPNVLSMLRDLGVWELLYEHCLYFSETSLAELFARAGFDVLDVRETFDRQFLSLVASPSVRENQRTDAKITRNPIDELVNQFQRTFNRKVKEWDQRLGSMIDQGQTVVVWGAGSRGVMFLNCVPAGRKVHAVIDINPRKRGSFIAGTGQPVLAPADLPQVKPDAVLVMNAVYADEIHRELINAGSRAQLTVVSK